MVAITSRECKKVAALLEEGAESPAHLAKSAIELLDEIRADKTLYIVTSQFGQTNAWYSAHGPYATRNQARKALIKSPALGEAVATAVVPLRSPQALDRLLAQVDEPHKPPAVTEVKRGRLQPQTDPSMDHVTEVHVLNRKTNHLKRVAVGK